MNVQMVYISFGDLDWHVFLRTGKFWARILISYTSAERMINYHVPEDLQGESRKMLKTATLAQKASANTNAVKK